MRLKLARRPWWFQALFYGPLFGVLMALFRRLSDGDWTSALVNGVVGALLFGPLMGLWASRLNRRMVGEVDHLPADELKAAVRAASRGAVPADPQVRAAARGLVLRQRDELLRTRRRSVLTFSIALVLDIVLALTQSPWWWLSAAFFIGFIVWTLQAPARLERRLQVLGGVGPS